MNSMAGSAGIPRFDEAALRRGAGSVRHPLARALLALTFSTGVVDAVSYLALGRVFTANMTGNVVLLGFGIAGGDGLPVVAPMVSLGAFLVGAHRLAVTEAPAEGMVAAGVVRPQPHAGDDRVGAFEGSRRPQPPNRRCDTPPTLTVGERFVAEGRVRTDRAESP